MQGCMGLHLALNLCVGDMSLVSANVVEGVSVPQLPTSLGAQNHEYVPQNSEPGSWAGARETGACCCHRSGKLRAHVKVIQVNLVC